MKKAISLLLTVMIVLSLSACGGNETTINNDTGSSTTQSQTDVTDTGSIEQNTDVPSSTTNNSGGSDSTDVPSSTNSKPTTTTKPEASKPTIAETETSKPSTPTHTHSYSSATCTTPAKCSCGVTNGSALGHSYSNATCTEAKKCSRCGSTSGSALGHKWTNATCTTPQTCSVCKVTEGNKLEHVVEGITCKWCKQIVAINPKNFDTSVNYVCAGNVGPRVSEYNGVTYNLFSLTYLKKDKDCYSMGGYVQSNPYADWPQVNGTYYAPTAEWNGQCGGLNGMWAYQIVGTEIVITAEVNYDGNKNAILHCQLLSDGSLKVISLSGTTIPTEAGIKVGAVFYPI